MAELKKYKTNFVVVIKGIYHSSLERAFKCPMLCDISKVHTGFMIMPKITHCTKDETWGKPGGSRWAVSPKTLFSPGGEVAIDRVIAREENKYWMIEVSEYKTWFMGIEAMRGEWITKELEPGKIEITYRYTICSNRRGYYIMRWLFARLFWKVYMKRVLRNIKILAEGNEPFQFE